MKTVLRASMATALAASVACAPAMQSKARVYSSYSAVSYPSARVHSSWYAAAMAMLRSADNAPELNRDESVGATGVLGQTVNEVVPIPGTDMIRVGALQEGTFFQSSFRNASQDATGGAGGRPGAVLIFRIFRP